jgi:hypothetical protein
MFADPQQQAQLLLVMSSQHIQELMMNKGSPNKRR